MGLITLQFALRMYVCMFNNAQSANLSSTSYTRVCFIKNDRHTYFKREYSERVPFLAQNAAAQKLRTI